VSESNGSNNGKDTRGRWAKGNPGGPGNPNIADMGKHRQKFFDALRDDDVEKALQTIRDVMNTGRDGEKLAAARELLDRVLGKVIQSDLLERIEALEAAVAARQER
jgi:hypothetical protein